MVLGTLDQSSTQSLLPPQYLLIHLQPDRLTLEYSGVYFPLKWAIGAVDELHLADTAV